MVKKLKFGQKMTKAQRAKAHLQIHAKAVYGDKKPKKYGELSKRRKK